VVLLLSRDDLAPLFTEDSALHAGLAVIREALVASTGPSVEHQSWLAYPLGVSAEKVHVNLLASPVGTSIRMFPPPARPTAATGDSLAMLLADDGRVEVLMDLHELGSWRTSGPAAVACEALAPPGARTVALLGSGTEAATLLRALRVAMPGLEEVRVSSRTPAHREAFAQRFTSGDLLVRAVSSPAEAVIDADVVLAAAAGGRPLFDAASVRAGALVATLVWGGVPDDLGATPVLPERVQPDARPTGWEPWPAPRPVPDGVLTVADVLRGAPARISANETLLYSQFGVYAWDAPLLRWAADTARARGAGTEFPLDSSRQ